KREPGNTTGVSTSSVAGERAVGDDQWPGGKYCSALIAREDAVGDGQWPGCIDGSGPVSVALQGRRSVGHGEVVEIEGRAGIDHEHLKAVCAVKRDRLARSVNGQCVRDR